MSVVAILSLALGIGANTAIFSVIESLLLRALPVDRPEQLALLVSNPAGALPGAASWSNPVWEQIRERRRELFETALAFSARPTRFNLASGVETDFVDGIWVSGDYFNALGVQPILGRALTGEDDRRGGGRDGPVAIISHGFWQRRFGGTGDVIGRTQSIDRMPFTIVGVTPPGFFGAEVGATFDIALPLGTEPLLRGRDSYLDVPTTAWLLIVARLREGQTLASAEQALRGVQPQIRAATMPANAAGDVKARYLAPLAAVRSASIGTSALRTRYHQPILAIMFVVALVLLIACANLANLLLARADARRHELSVRLALGASRWRLARPLLAESVLLVLAGGLFGVFLAHWAGAFLVRQLSTQVNTVFLDVQLNARVLTFTAGIASVATLFFGLVPAIRASRAAPIDAIREQGRGAVGARGMGFGSVLVAAQIALSIVLVVAAALFVRTFAALATRDLGFDRDAVLIARLDVRAAAAQPTQRPALYGAIADAARTLAGVSNAAVSAITPVSGGVIDTVVEVEDGPSLTMPKNVSYRNVITPDWFATYGTRVIAGRDFDVRDRDGSTLVAVVNQAFARRFFDRSSPIGRRIRLGLPGRQGPWLEVVGVVEDATYRSLREPLSPTLYVPLAQQKEPPPSMSLSARAANGAAAGLSRGLTDVVGQVDRSIVSTFTPLKQQVDAALVQERLLATLSGFFGALSLLLAGLGIYGMTWYAVSRRRTEIGIRMALGATRFNVAGLVLSRLSRTVLVGVAAGSVICLWASKFVATLLYEVEPRDLLTLMSGAAILAVVAAFAGWIPAQRASRTDPARVLRES